MMVQAGSNGGRITLPFASRVMCPSHPEYSSGASAGLVLIR